MSAPTGPADSYRLRPLRDARERDERVKKGDLAAAIGDAQELAASVQAADERVRTAREAVADAARARASMSQVEASRLALAERYAARRRRELGAAQADQARARAAQDAQLGEVDAARSRLVGARADREAIERHFARWREERKKAAERRED